jgi:transcriptional regulator with XRE-family HTH domain
MLHSAQIRAARALLNWRQEDLARTAEVAITTVQRIEKPGRPSIGSNVSTLIRIQEAFERAGIQFIETDSTGGIGLRLVHPKTKKQKSSMR